MRENTPPRFKGIETPDNEEIRFIVDEDDDLDEVIFEDNDEIESPDENEDGDEEIGENSPERSPKPVVKDDSILTFSLHEAPVFTGAFHPTKDWVVTGGEDDRAFIWNSQTGEVIKEIGDHKDTVTNVHFSSDGSYLATGDMSGEIQVFKIKNEVTRVQEHSMGDITWMRWHTAANVLLVGGVEGEIFIWRITTGEIKILPGAGDRCEAADLSHDGKKLFAGYGNGTLKLWDMKAGTVIMEVRGDEQMVHMTGVSSVSCNKENPIYMSGSEDERLLFLTNNGVMGSVDSTGPVECVEFAPPSELKIAASASLHGEIAIWDYAKCVLRTVCDHPIDEDDGVISLRWISPYMLIVGTLAGNIYGFDARSGAKKFTLTGHLGDIYDVQYNSREHIILSVSEDKTAKIFKLPQMSD